MWERWGGILGNDKGTFSLVFFGMKELEGGWVSVFFPAPVVFIGKNIPISEFVPTQSP